MTERQLPSLAWYGAAVAEIGKSNTVEKVTSEAADIRFRLVEQSARSAAYLKLVRYVSGLHAGRILVEAGHTQELCVIQRTLDEMHEDLLFLSMPYFGVERISEHKTFLNAFWEDEPNFGKFSSHQKNRHQVPRKKIRAYLSKVNPQSSVDHSAITTSAYLGRIYSGYVHAAAPQIMDMFNETRRTFEVNGISDDRVIANHHDDFANQFFRGVLNVYVVARLYKLDALAKTAFELHNSLEPNFT